MTAIRAISKWWRELVADTKYMLGGGVRIVQPAPVQSSVPDAKTEPIALESVVEPKPKPPKPSNELRVDDAGRLTNWPSPPAPEPRRVQCAYETVIVVKCDGGLLRDSLGCQRGQCPVCMGGGEVVQ